MIGPTCSRHDTKRPCALILDLDGTLALLDGRDPYDASTCHWDILNTPVAEMVACYQDANPDHKTIIITGRPNKHRAPTERFLDTHGIHYHLLYMRENEDWRADAVYKREIYDTHIANWYNIHAVFEDKKSVCAMWHSVGVPVFRVGDPELEE